MLKQLWNDESGFIVSSELILISTILVIGMVVGLSEVQHAVVQELGDVADAIGSVNQSYRYSGFSARKSGRKRGLKSFTVGSRFNDREDDCDNNQCDLDCDSPKSESSKS